jgi:hypothetical protein
MKQRRFDFCKGKKNKIIRNKKKESNVTSFRFMSVRLIGRNKRRFDSIQWLSEQNFIPTIEPKLVDRRSMAVR